MANFIESNIRLNTINVMMSLRVVHVPNILLYRGIISSSLSLMRLLLLGFISSMGNFLSRSLSQWNIHFSAQCFSCSLLKVMFVLSFVTCFLNVNFLPTFITFSLRIDKVFFSLWIVQLTKLNSCESAKFRAIKHAFDDKYKVELCLFLCWFLCFS